MTGSRLDRLVVDVLNDVGEDLPDPDATMHAVRRGIRRRRHRDGAVAAVAAFAVLLGASATVGGYLAGPPPQPQSGTPKVQPVTEKVFSFTYGWLPDDLRAQRANPGPGVGAYIDTEVTATQDAGPADPAWSPIEVKGRPGRLISKPTRTIVDWQLPSGHFAHVEFGRGVPGAPNGQPAIEHDTLHIVDEFAEGPEKTLTTAIGLGFLPARCHVDGLNEQQRIPAVNVYCGSPNPPPRRLTTEDGITETVTNRLLENGVSISYADPQDAKTWERDLDHRRRIADIQELPAYTSLPEGETASLSTYQLYVKGFHGGMLVLSANTRELKDALTLDELVKIASNVVWTG
jgi:hypothetical protein